jgi:signal transduction histidine kinase
MGAHARRPLGQPRHRPRHLNALRTSGSSKRERGRFWPEGVAIAAGLLAAAIGTSVLVGWATGIIALTSISPRFIVMLPNTGAGMLAGGLAILLLRWATRYGVLAARVLAVLVLGLGVLSFVSRLVGHDVGYVSVLFYDRVALHPYRPVGLMATNSTVVFMFAGAALLLVSSGRPEYRQTARVLAIMGGAIAGVALLGHLYGVRALYAIDRAAGMALLTATSFAAIQVGILFLRPHDSGVSLVTGPDLAGSVMRRLLPLTIALPILLGWIWIEGREGNWYSRETGVALNVVLTVAWITTLLLYNARYIRDADRQRGELLASEQRAREVAEAASKVKSDFLAVMSHELRTPLNAIVGYTGLLSDGLSGPLTPLQQRDLTRIAESARHLTNVVNDILALARLDSGKDDARRETVSIPMLLHEVAGILEPLARAKGIEFVCECNAHISVHSDPHHLKQILINLGGNAVKFTSLGHVHIAGHVEDGRLVVSIADTGVGIAVEHLDRIFEEFWQVEQPLTRSNGGAGLGLSVSRRLARRLGGDITVASRPGAGSTFFLTIPGARVHDAPVSPESSKVAVSV